MPAAASRAISMTRSGLRHWFREAVLVFTSHLMRLLVHGQNLGRPSAVGVEEDDSSVESSIRSLCDESLSLPSAAAPCSNCLSVQSSGATGPGSNDCQARYTFV